MALAGAIGAAAPAAAQSKPGFTAPVYHPESKSYFEMIKVEVYGGVNWVEAFKQASQRAYKGARGRLAIVRTPEVHDFLRTTFRPYEPTWIGMRYLCDERQVEYSDGQLMQRTAFQAWHIHWLQSEFGAGCGEGQYLFKKRFLTIAVGPVQEGFRWFAKGAAKKYSFYIVEYPTGAP